MPNPHVPTNLRVIETAANRVTVGWDHPSPELERLFSYRVYISPAATNPIPGAPVVMIPQKQYTVSGFTSNVYITASSVNSETGEESAQSASFFVSIDHTASGIGGAVAKSDTDVPKYLRTDESGNLQVNVAVAAPVGGATEAKQDVQITQLASILAALGAGNPFNEFWEDSVPANVMTQVHAITVPPGETFFLTGIYVTGRYPAILELKLDAMLAWRGRTNDVDPDKLAVFGGGPIKAVAGTVLSLHVQHGFTGSLTFAGNMFGYKS